MYRFAVTRARAHVADRLTRISQVPELACFRTPAWTCVQCTTVHTYVEVADVKFRREQIEFDLVEQKKAQRLKEIDESGNNVQKALATVRSPTSAMRPGF